MNKEELEKKEINLTEELDELQKQEQYLKKENKVNNEKNNERDSILRILIQGLITSLVTGLLIYYLTKQDNQVNWCNNEIKNFDEKNYKSKDIAVLSKICKDELLEYDLFSNLIYDVEHNETKYFGKTINKLFIDKKVDKQLIDDISLFKLVNILNNERFVYVDTSTKKNDLFSVNKYIEKFLIFHNEIDFEKYKQSQLDNLFSIFSEIYNNEKLVKSTIFQSFHPPIPYDEDLLESPILLNNFMLFRQIIKKIDKNKVDTKDYIYTHTKFDQSSINYKLQLIFNSYIFLNKKEELIQEAIKLFGIIKNKESYLTKEGVKLLILILLELGDNYELTKEELHSIYDSYSYSSNINKIYLHYSRVLIDQLVYNLKNERFMSNNDIYTEYFVKTIKNKKFIFNNKNENFIWFLSKKGSRKLLTELFYSYKNNDRVQNKIFRAMVLSSSRNYNYIPNNKVTSNDILKILKETKDSNQKAQYIKYSLYTKNYELILNSINYINSSKEYYKKQLDRINHYAIVYDYFYYESIFTALGNTVPTYIGKQKEIKTIKIELFINFIELTSSKESKFELFKLLVNMLQYNDFNLTKKIEKIIYKEKDNILKKNYINYFNDKRYYIKQNRIKANYD